MKCSKVLDVKKKKLQDLLNSINRLDMTFCCQFVIFYKDDFAKWTDTRPLEKKKKKGRGSRGTGTQRDSCAVKTKSLTKWNCVLQIGISLPTGTG